MLRIFYSFTVCNFEKRVESVARFNQYKLWIKSHMFKPKSLFTSKSRRVISQNERKLNLKLILFNVNSLHFIVTSVFWFVIFFKKHLPQKVCIFATILAGSVKNFGEVSSATNSSDHFSPKSRHFKWNIFFLASASRVKLSHYLFDTVFRLCVWVCVALTDMFLNRGTKFGKGVVVKNLSTWTDFTRSSHKADRFPTLKALENCPQKWTVQAMGSH